MISARRTRTRIPVALALAGVILAGSPLLAGCSVIENFLPGGSIPDGVVPSASVPDDFPKDDVPLIEGDVVLGISIPGENGDTAWNVTIKVTGAEAFDTITTELTDAGFSYQELGSNNEGTSGSFTKDPYTVIVVVAQSDGDWNANYTVTDASGE